MKGYRLDWLRGVGGHLLLKCDWKSTYEQIIFEFGGRNIPRVVSRPGDSCVWEAD